MGKPTKRLQVRIDADLYDQVNQLGGVVSQDIVEELLWAGLAIKQGAMVETDSLPVIRELVQTELRKAEARLRSGIREDLEQTAKETGQRQANRLAALLVQAIREAGLGRRMLFAFVARAVSEDFARAIFEGAREAVGRDLAANKRSDPHQ